MPYYGFNFQWMFSWEPNRRPEPPDLRALDFLAETGFNFVRVPMDYRFWTRDFDYFHPDARVFENMDRYLAACQQRGLHLSLNLHRAPGYCINRNDLERHNLWLDSGAQNAFVFLWETFARRYQGVSSADLSFDLVNEPPEIGQYGMTRANHAAVMRRATAVIRVVDPNRAITIDGLAGGNLAMPELADLGATHSGRGYQPMPVSHYEAAWWAGSVGLPEPAYPNTDWDNHCWNRATLRAFYQPWREVEAQGVPVHIGECGCYDHTPNDVALRWFTDLFGVFKEFGWGFSLWNFVGSFGIIGHERPGARFVPLHGYRVDRDLLELMITNRA
ncbi:MAG: cellulase family glycosylhydrolase [Anaerolineae bacterium]|nr:cellulase family glycosylhydrolase [Anaerolineae bacterium]